MLFEIEGKSLTPFTSSWVPKELELEDYLVAVDTQFMANYEYAMHKQFQIYRYLIKSHEQCNYSLKIKSDSQGVIQWLVF